MSTGADCRFKEVEPGRWSYWLQSWPYGDSESGQTYGPFPSFTAAETHLSRNHANPGGFTVQKLEPGHLHEWFEDSEMQVKVGFTVEVRVESLGPDATREAVIDRVKAALAEGDPRKWTIRPAYGMRRLVACAACGEPRDGWESRFGDDGRRGPLEGH